MNIAFLINSDEIADYPSDILINDEIYTNCDFFSVLSFKDCKIACAKSMPAEIISKLRAEGIVFFKVNSIEEAEKFFDINLNPDSRIKRGVGCQNRLRRVDGKIK
jgi:hypothetical protein